MVARLREYGYDVSYYENVEGGHGAAADNEQLAFKQAPILEFRWGIPMTIERLRRYCTPNSR